MITDNRMRTIATEEMLSYHIDNFVIDDICTLWIQHFCEKLNKVIKLKDDDLKLLEEEKFESGIQTKALFGKDLEVECAVSRNFLGECKNMALKFTYKKEKTAEIFLSYEDLIGLGREKFEKKLERDVDWIFKTLGLEEEVT